ncbi:hypothetical protein BU16DRAFT_620148 [Lophium mytilinum]|uniref:3'-5' exonuclease domain-containing protein n=1 Tax=Lophium mytilinum TaxID=390894 RepID=A0A6A6QKM0_9PEZI|nr:hypothetical protein BU16DRAFT_620148 [Lophium mytilinum]
MPPNPGITRNVSLHSQTYPSKAHPHPQGPSSLRTNPKPPPKQPRILYLLANSHSLTIYVAPASTVNILDLSDLNAALRRNDKNALALKWLLEASPIIKVFFDARVAAQILFERCEIKLAVEGSIKRAYIHELQMMEVALRRSDRDREWLAGLDRCIAQDSDLAGGMGVGVVFDRRILHLPILWQKYHGQLTRGGFDVGGPFWIMMIREATKERLEVARSEKHRGYDADGARSGWWEESIQERSDSWNEGVMMDPYTEGEFMGGKDHWTQFDVL